jgi:carbamoylphosphate synthase large subunit
MRRKKNILISAAGTASAFHLAEVVQQRFSKSFDLILCDTNPKHLVPSAAFTHRFYTVPAAKDPAFRKTMLDLFVREKTEIYIPLVDTDVYAFPCDDPELRELGVLSTSPPAKSVDALRNKRLLAGWLRSHSLPAPQVFRRDELDKADPHKKYFVKPEEGFGSHGTSFMTTAEIMQLADSLNGGLVLQEACLSPEITIEVYNAHGTVRAISRERLEVKCGVCTKARLWIDREFTMLAELLCQQLVMPVAFCFQVMKNPQQDWVITDVNPRIGAGTSLSSVCGWSLAVAALAEWGQLPENPLDFLQTFEGNRYAVRAFKDFRTQ